MDIDDGHFNWYISFFYLNWKEGTNEKKQEVYCFITCHM